MESHRATNQILTPLLSLSFIVCSIFLFFCRCYLSTGSFIGTISIVFILHTVCAVGHDENHPRSCWLLFEIRNWHHIANCTIASRIPSHFINGRQRIHEIMRISRNPIPTHRHDQIEQFRVSILKFIHFFNLIRLQRLNLYVLFFFHTTSCSFANHSKHRFMRICMWFAPDIVMLLSSLISYVVLRKLTASPVTDDAEVQNSMRANDAANEDDDIGSGYTLQNYLMLKRAAIFLAMAALLFAATLRPSVPSAIYFLFFLVTATVWALNKEIDRGFAIICRLLLIVLFVHITVLFIYQMPYPQEIFDANNTLVR